MAGAEVGGWKGGPGIVGRAGEVRACCLDPRHQMGSGSGEHTRSSILSPEPKGGSSKILPPRGLTCLGSQGLGGSSGTP